MFTSLAIDSDIPMGVPCPNQRYHQNTFQRCLPHTVWNRNYRKEAKINDNRKFSANEVEKAVKGNKWQL